MGVFKWLLNKLQKVELDKGSWHNPSRIVQRRHHKMIRFNTFVHNSLSENAQLEHIRSERDSHFVREEAFLAQMRLLSSEIEKKMKNPVSAKEIWK